MRRLWKLVIIDQEPIRHAAVRAYQQAGERLAGLLASITHFNSVDKPAYTGWISANFGPILTQYRELADKIAEKGAMLDGMRMMTLLGGLTPYEAYQEMLKNKTRVDNFFAQDGPGDGSVEEDGEEEPSEEELREEDEIFAQVFEDMFGTPMPDETRSAGKPPPSSGGEATHGNGDRRRGRRRPTAADAQAQSTAQRLRSAYRLAARRLHPDMHPDLSDHDKHLWYDAQDAYERGDLERLETILAVSEMAGGGEWPSTSALSGLLALTRRRQASSLQLEKERRRLTRDTAWNFTALKSTSALKKRTETRLRRELAELRSRWTLIEREFAYYDNAPPPRARKRTAKKAKGRKRGR